MHIGVFYYTHICMYFAQEIATTNLYLEHTTFKVHNKKSNQMLYERSYIWTAEKDMKT